MIQIGQKVNGYTIIAIAKMHRLDNELVILGESDENYVTARMDPNNDKEWFWGNYFHKHDTSTYDGALRNFTSRVAN